jgi:hypothetical protein
VITRRVGLVALKVRYDARLRLKIKRPWDVRVRKVDEKLPKGIETWSLTSLQQRQLAVCCRRRESKIEFRLNGSSP